MVLQLHVCVETVWYEAVAKSRSTSAQFVKWLKRLESNRYLCIFSEPTALDIHLHSLLQQVQQRQWVILLFLHYYSLLCMCITSVLAMASHTVVFARKACRALRWRCSSAVIRGWSVSTAFLIFRFSALLGRPSGKSKGFIRCRSSKSCGLSSAVWRWAVLVWSNWWSGLGSCHGKTDFAGTTGGIRTGTNGSV